ncbi:MAG: pentapeptide repeat-containing protein, partial [Roseicyclus sp.]|nr:pentapeptide repeat-containing protein [Roseicyclus sp.]
MTETITLPISPTAFWLIVILVGTLLATLVAALSGQRGERPPSDSTWSRFLTRIGLQGAPETLALFGALFWAILALALAGGIIITLVTLLTAFAASPDPADTTLRWTLLTLTALTGALGAVVALPLTLIRIRQTQRQTNLQDESLFNDKINAAATDLAARQQVTRVLHADTPEECIATEWQDDLVTRAAAIDRLEGLALERADVAPRIARMLSIYVQELSREHPAKPVPEGASPGELLGWAQTLRPITRPDMERAVQSLGRINPTDEGARAAFDPTNIDLRRCNLQGFDLTQRNYQGARLDEAQIQGANLSRAQMQGAVLSRAQIQGADLSRAQMQGAVFS